MRKGSFLVISISILLVLCLPVVSLAKPPYRAQILGAYLDSGENPSVKAVNVVPVNNNTFGIYSNDDLELCTRLYLYFGAGTNGISNFNIQIKLLSEGYQLNTSANNIAYSRLNNVTSSGVVSDSIAVGSDLRQTYDGNTITWQYIRSSVIDRNGILLVLTFQNFMLGSTPVYFEVLNFSVNGIPFDEIEVTEYNAEFEDTISELAQNEERMWAQVIAPDLTDTFDRIQQQNNETYSDYKAVIASVSVDNFLIPGLLMIVFSFAFYSYVVFGRKG